MRLASELLCVSLREPAVDDPEHGCGAGPIGLAVSTCGAARGAVLQATARLPGESGKASLSEDHPA